jgi:predicted Fe-Mo cluster-binding NifX family protein
MKIAVTSQNRKTVTGHAGKCRKFWVYEVEDNVVQGKKLLELSLEQSFHESNQAAPHPLDEVNVLISGGMGQGLQFRLKQKGIQALSTAETDPDQAIQRWLAGTLDELPAETHDHSHEHEHDHGHGHGHAHPISHGSESINILSVDQQFFKIFAERP